MHIGLYILYEILIPEGKFGCYSCKAAIFIRGNKYTWIINIYPYNEQPPTIITNLSCPLVMIVKRRMNAYILCGDAVSDVTSSPSGDHSGYAYLHMPPLSK